MTFPATDSRAGNVVSPNEVRGEVLRVVFNSDDGQYSVVKLRDLNGRERVLVGALGGLLEGQEIEARGRWETHKEHGQQFRVDQFKAVLPSSEEGIRRYLASGLIHGIGPKYAERIVDRFGAETLDIMSNYSARLKEVPGIGAKRIAEIRRAWQEHAEQRDVLIFFQGLGISAAYCNRIIQQYGAAATEIVRKTPYRLAADVRGIGFKMADDIAEKVGVGKEDPVRLAAGILHVLSQLANQGHVCYPRTRLLEETAKTLDAEREAVEAGLRLATEAGRAIVTQYPSEPPRDIVYQLPLYQAERQLAEAVSLLLQSLHQPLDLPRARLGAAFSRLNQAQRQAVEWAFQYNLSIITGGPGVGKTTVVGQIVAGAQLLQQNILLAAPTGRAAKRMSESSPRAASTIHRLLKWDPVSGGFQHGPDKPLLCDVLIVDEVSMLDLPLATSLFRAVAPGTRVVLVGDRDQLPSVGPGTVLYDLISCGRVPVTELTEIYRQSETSRIVTNAHAVNRGQMPETSTPPEGMESDFYWIEREDAESAAETIVKMVVERMPRRFGFDPMRDIQVLAPMRRGICGAESLNRLLQNALNPKGAELHFGDRIFRAGDRVMQTVNNYDKKVYNGELGRVRKIDYAERKFNVEFDTGTVEYDWQDSDQIVLAYAVTVHKSQGSEFPAVVMPLLTQHYMMLQRNLVYTGMTRAQRLLVMVGSHQALHTAVRTVRQSRRYSLLRHRIVSGDF